MFQTRIDPEELKPDALFLLAQIIDPDTVSAAFEQYAKQIKMGIGIDLSKLNPTDPRFELYANLQADAARFATFRDAQLQRELKTAKTDLERQRIQDKYKEYLLTEKQTIFAQSSFAERWAGFQENADIYPNLEWRTAGDNDVRPEHAALDGLILPIDDPFWNSHTPPLGFGCRCELVQTDAKVNKTESYTDTPAPKGFDFNPGIDQKLFSDTAGYYTSAPKDVIKTLTDSALNFSVKNSRNYGTDAAGTIVNVANVGKVNFTKKGVKEALNQPHRDYAAKNMLLENPKGLLKNLTFTKGAASKSNPMVKQYLYAEIKLMGESSWVVLREMINGEMQFYSIVDNLKGYK